MSNIYYGWIPILGTRLYFNYAIEELEKSGKEVSKEDVESLGIKYDPKHKYYSIYTREDVKNKEFKSIVSVDKNNKVDNIYITDKEGKKLKAQAGCEIDDRGLVALELKSPEEKDVYKERDKAYAFYRIVRDIYHTHTHHNDSKDSLLKIVPTNDKSEAIEQILSHFEQKIVIAHKELRNIATVLSPREYDYAARLITQSEGEMIYALNFVNLFKAEIRLKTQNPEKDKEYNFVFSNALQSLNVLASNGYNYLNYKYNYLNYSTTMILTYAIFLLTFEMAINPSSMDPTLKAILLTLGLIGFLLSAYSFFKPSIPPFRLEIILFPLRLEIILLLLGLILLLLGLFLIFIL